MESGGRPGYEQEWRADPDIVSGGQLMEQGIHAVDLARWFLGEFSQVAAFVETRFWDMGPVEDNAFALYRTPVGAIASVHASLTQWKNLFSFEVYGNDGYVAVEVLGGGYGTEKAIFGERNFTAPFSEDVVEFRARTVRGTRNGRSSRRPSQNSGSPPEPQWKVSRRCGSCLEHTSQPGPAARSTCEDRVVSVCLITGVGGFLGSHLADFLLSQGWDMVGVLRRDSPNIAHIKRGPALIRCDIASKAQLEDVVRSVRPEVIFHLAGPEAASGLLDGRRSRRMFLAP